MSPIHAPSAHPFGPREFGHQTRVARDCGCSHGVRLPGGDRPVPLTNCAGCHTRVLELALHRRTPWVGKQLQQQVNRYSAEPAVLMRQLGIWIQAWASELAALAGGSGRNLGKLLVTMVTVFVFCADGENIIAQRRRVLVRFFGDRLDPYVATMATMRRPVVQWLHGPPINSVGCEEWHSL